MSFIENTPSIKVKVPNKYLGMKDEGSTSGYLSTVKSVDGNALLFSVYLSSGALFSNLPIEALWCDKYSEINFESELKNPELQPYSCLDGDIDVIEISLLKHCNVLCKINGEELNGTYLFTVDYNGNDLADSPEQRKSHNIIVLRSGQLCALPNNHCLFLNDSLSDNEGAEWPRYRRIDKYYLAGS